ncbi:alpha/beta hydrolase [Microbacterium sp.]|uniref:alpha/beta hydrolase n=1 Tax=Microbacterium sp. TaxID=51671 RepID=UPI0039E2E408
MHRVTGPVERARIAQGGRRGPDAALLATVNPRIDPDPDDPSGALWTWVIDAPEATAVALWTSAVFDHRDVTAAEFSRLPDSTLWTICLRLPAALRTAYRIAVWCEPGPAPWRTAAGRRPVILAAMAAGAADERCPDAMGGADGRPVSVAAGPAAPREPWRGMTPARRTGSRVDAVPLAHGERAWVYHPGRAPAPTPLLVLFDGQMWRELGLPGLLDGLIASGRLPALHVAMLDSGDADARWERLGVPGGQVHTVLDELLPRVRSGWPVDAAGAATLVAGQSLGGLAALWTLALGQGEVRRAIAQSPSLWRFSIVDALLDEPRWDALTLEAGTFEPDMLRDVHEAAATLLADARRADRAVHVHTFEAGHDWAAWRVHLLRALASQLGDSPAATR